MLKYTLSSSIVPSVAWSADGPPYLHASEGAAKAPRTPRRDPRDRGQPAVAPNPANQITVRGRVSTTSRTSTSTCRATGSSCSPACPARASRRSPFDTIYAEGQRRYVESLSSYARQFLGQMDKPDVDIIEGLSPAISIDQKSASRNPRSTVGTITEVYDYLRLLYARIGVQHCPNDGTRLQRQTPQQIVDRILLLPEGTRFQVLAPVVRGRKGEYDTLLEDLSGQGYVRARIDGEVVDIDEFLKRDERLARYEQHTIEIVVDRLVRRDGHRAAAHRLARDRAAAGRRRRRGRDRRRAPTAQDENETMTFSQHLVLPDVRHAATTSRRRATSRSTRRTARARRATASARRSRSTPSWSSPTPTCRSTRARSPRGAAAHTQYFTRMLEAVAEAYDIDLDAPWGEAHGEAAEGHPRTASRARSPSSTRTATAASAQYTTAYEGVIPWIKRRHEGSESDWSREQYEGYMREVPCHDVQRGAG